MSYRHRNHIPARKDCITGNLSNRYGVGYCAARKTASSTEICQLIIHGF